MHPAQMIVIGVGLYLLIMAFVIIARLLMGQLEGDEYLWGPKDKR